MRTRTDIGEYLSRLADIRGYFRTRKRLWLAPIIVFFAAFGVLLALAEAPVLAPFIYALF